jgi:hypothetical protein
MAESSELRLAIDEEFDTTEGDDELDEFDEKLDEFDEKLDEFDEKLGALDCASKEIELRLAIDEEFDATESDDELGEFDEKLDEFEEELGPLDGTSEEIAELDAITADESESKIGPRGACVSERRSDSLSSTTFHGNVRSAEGMMQRCWKLSLAPKGYMI